MEQIWTNGQLIEGEFDPIIDARNTALAIAAIYELPL